MMRLIPLSQFLVLPDAVIPLPIGKDPIALSNDYAVIMFENMALKRRFFSRLSRVTLQGQVQTNLRRMVVIECGQPIPAIANNKQVITVRSPNPEELLNILRGIPKNQLPSISDCVLNTIIIENLSAYYWELRSRPRTQEIQWYTELAESIQLLRSRYKCNVVVTLWDKTFESGYDATPTDPKAPYVLSEMTLTPMALFSRSSMVIAERTHQSLKFQEDVWSYI